MCLCLFTILSSILLRELGRGVKIRRTSVAIPIWRGRLLPIGGALLTVILPSLGIPSDQGNQEGGEERERQRDKETERHKFWTGN